MAPSMISTFIYTILFLTTLSPVIEGSPCFSCAVAGVGFGAISAGAAVTGTGLKFCDSVCKDNCGIKKRCTFCPHCLK